MPIPSKLSSTYPLTTKSSHLPNVPVFHGGKSFEAIGIAFDHLERAQDVISADVLDAWFDPSPRVLRKIRDFLPFLARTSPPVRAAGLLQAIASHRGIGEDCVLAGGGSSDLIFSCIPHMIEANRRALILDPMYGEYHHLLRTVMGVEVARFNLGRSNDFAVETDAIATEAREMRADLVIVVNPNSPTGRHWPRCELMRFIDDVPSSTTVVIDETYIEYVGSEESVEREAARRPNLIVIKSMSKVYALSGLRVGYLVAHPSTIRRLALWVPPWSVSLPAQLAAIEALDDPLYYQERYRQTVFLRDRMTSHLASIPGLKIYPSKANCLLVETASSAETIVDAMSDLNIFVRNCDSMSAQFNDRFIRIAVKEQRENERIAEALQTVTRKLG
jgi:histidinol-phosphate aminotransferase